MGPEAESESAIADSAPAGVTVVMSSEAWDALRGPRLRRTSSSSTARAVGIVGQGTAPDWDQVVRLMTEAGDDGALEAARADVDPARPAGRAPPARRPRAASARADEILMVGRASTPAIRACTPTPDPDRARASRCADAPRRTTCGCTLPAGWDGRITVRARRRAGGLRTAGGRRSLFTAQPQPVVHLANFGLPEERGDFGSGAVELMGDRDVFVVLFEYEPEAAQTALFATRGHAARARPRATSTRRCCAAASRARPAPGVLPGVGPGVLPVRRARERTRAGRGWCRS